MYAAPLTEKTVAALKRRLWLGEAYGVLADEYEINFYTLSAIVYGKRHRLVPWPDGSTGPMSQERRAQIRHARRQAANEVEASVARRTQALLRRDLNK